MEFQPVTLAPGAYSGDALLLGVFEGELESALASLPSEVIATVKEVVEEEEFKAKALEKIIVRVSGGSVRKVVLVGLGASDKVTHESLRQAAGEGARALKTSKAVSAGIAFPGSAAQEIVEGVLLALHDDDRFRSKSEENGGVEPKKLTTVSVLLESLEGAEAAIRWGLAVADGTIFARELVSAPANYVTPMYMADQAVAIAEAGGLEYEILEREDCEKLGMGAYLGVAQGTDMPPKFIHLTYKPADGKPRQRLAFVGKGLTFDSGGLSIKTSEGMKLMKVDMGGAAAALGAAKALAQIKPDVEIHFIVAATENMVSGHAIRPGDILTASNGKTIEVDNTDAEGRLTLADALVFAEKLGVDAIVDLATLTGACLVALGNDIAGLLSPDEALAERVKKAAEESGEKFWQLPMEESYFESMKSVVADMRNTGSREGGTITGALFLKQFVEKTPWVHLDIAGPVWTEKQKGYINRGGTGFGVRTLVQLALDK
ncbi:MAG: leucyl aminopeptidase [Anaerolineae bacterium]|nr:leucyl aminopeptidase [Gloeobacterales cyanobacterium ES-bin-313]